MGTTTTEDYYICITYKRKEKQGNLAINKDSIISIESLEDEFVIYCSTEKEYRLKSEEIIHINLQHLFNFPMFEHNQENEQEPRENFFRRIFKRLFRKRECEE